MMEQLENDPIISFYMRMSNSTENERELPVFSETMLRLSFKEICGPLRLPKTGDLQLYRKLLLLNYSEKYPSITDLIKIMSCFDEAEIHEYFDNYLEILEQWRTFLRLNLNNVLYKEAFTEILFEYTKRYLSLFGAINNNKLMKKAEEIQKFLRDGERLPKFWTRDFNAVLNSRIFQTKFEQYENITVEDLEVANIFQDLKESLNFLLVEAVEYKIGMQDVSAPPKKKMLLNQIKSETEEVYEIKDDESISNESEVNQTNLKTDDYESQEILEEVVLVNSDIENEDSENEGSYESNNLTDNDNPERGDVIENSKNSQDEDLEFQRVLNDSTAISYLAALQAYAVVNGHFEAIGLLDKVDSLFRLKLARK